MLPFDAEVLASLVAQYNALVWPAPLLAPVLCLIALVLACRGGGGRAVVLLLAVGWAWTGVAFHYGTFAALNFMAPTYAVVFLIEAVLLTWLAWRRSLAFAPDAAGLGLAVLALVGWPLLSLGTSFGLSAAEVAGIAPDPTALFTLGLLLMARGRGLWMVAVLPVLWTLVGAATAWVLDREVVMAQGVLGPAAAVLLVRRRSG